MCEGGFETDWPRLLWILSRKRVNNQIIGYFRWRISSHRGVRVIVSLYKAPGDRRPAWRPLRETSPHHRGEWFRPLHDRRVQKGPSFSSSHPSLLLIFSR